MEQAAVPVAHLVQHEVRRSFRGAEIPLFVRDPVDCGQGRDHQAVPIGQHLRILERPRPLIAGEQELSADRFDPGFGRIEGGPGLENGPVRKPALVKDMGFVVRASRPAGVSGLPDPEGQGCDLRLLGAQRPVEFAPRPEIELALFAFAVGVLGREEAACRGGEVPQDVVRDLGRRASELVPAGRREGLGVDLGQEGLVVEHLFEMGDEPIGVGRIAMEAEAEVVEDAAAAHGLEGLSGHAQGLAVAGPLPVSQQKADVVGEGELGRAAETTPGSVEIRRQLAESLVQGRRGQLVAALAPELDRAPFDRGGHLPGRPKDLRPLRPPGLADRGKELEQTRPSETAGLRVIGPGEERLPVGGHHDGQRPAARAGERLADGHVVMIEVRPFFAVDLDGDKVRVDQPRCLFVGEGFLLHDVAPVAGRIADRQEDRLVLAPGPFERLRPPGIPIHGIMGVLEEVRAPLPGQAVHDKSPFHVSTCRPALPPLAAPAPTAGGRSISSGRIPPRGHVRRAGAKRPGRARCRGRRACTLSPRSRGGSSPRSAGSP